MDLHGIGRHLLAGTAVEEVDIFLAYAKGRAHAVDGDVPATHHGNPLPFGIGVCPLVDAVEVLYPRDKALISGLLPFDPHGHGILSTCSDEDGCVFLFHCAEGDVFPHLGIRFDLYP